VKKSPLWGPVGLSILIHALLFSSSVFFASWLKDSPLAGGGFGGGRLGHEGGGVVHVEIVKSSDVDTMTPEPVSIVPKDKPSYTLPKTPPTASQKPSKKTGPTIAPLPGPVGPGLGEGQGPGVGSGSGSGSGAEGTNATLAEILARIERAKRYPAVARRMGHEGRTRVAFRIGPGGEAVNPTVKVSSSHEALDEEAVATIRRAAPFPVYEKPLEVWIVFEIKN
jgi:TonB family protein